MYNTMYLKKRKRLVIKNKFRFITFITISILLITSSVSILLNLDRAYSSSFKTYYEVRVVPGDTLWSLAKNNNKNNDDIREIIHTIKSINKLENSIIKPGDIVKIPIN